MNNKPVWYNGSQPWVPFHTIFLTKAGSKAYGTSTPESDTDLRGVCIPPVHYTLGALNDFEQYVQLGDPDVCIYDLRKFCQLALKGNPNVLELLFSWPGDWIQGDHFGSEEGHEPTAEERRKRPWACLHQLRHAFLSRKAHATFAGYAVSQLQKLRQGKANGTRGPAREDLIRKFGYDTKNGMHLVRLLRSGLELMRTGELTVKRPDAAELLEIRNGAWSLQKIEAYARLAMVEMDEAAKDSPLPEQPNAEAVDWEVINIMREWTR